MATGGTTSRRAGALLGLRALPGTMVAGAMVAGAASAQAEGLAAVEANGLEGQIILNPEPDFGAPSPVRRAQEALLALEPGAGVAGANAPDAPMPGCQQPDGWSVVVVRGSEEPEVVSGGHMITVMPPGC